MKKTLRGSCAMCFLALLTMGCGAGNANQQDAAQRTDFEETVLQEPVQLLPATDLNDWKGDLAYWRLEDGELIGETSASTPPLKANTFLIFQQPVPEDFELVTEFKISAAGNSGINYRSELVDEVPNALKGYQADIDGQNNYTGQNYEERKRTTLAYRGEVATILNQEGGEVVGNAWTGRRVDREIASSDSLKDLIKAEDWNECKIVVKGNTLSHYINGHLMSEVIDEDALHQAMDGLLGLQIHTGPPMQVRYRNMTIRPL